MMPRKKSLPLIKDFDNIPDEALVPAAEQPYPIPAHWRWVRFANLNTFTSASISPLNFPDTSFTLYSVPSFAVREPEITRGKEIGSSKQRVRPGDVLLCKINPRINRVWVVTSPHNATIASSEWIVFRPSYGASTYYELYFSSPIFRQLLCSETSGVGGSLTRARPKNVAKYPIPLPPLDEQERIVAQVTERLEQIDEAVARLEKFLRDSETRRHHIIDYAMRGHLTKEWRATRTKRTDARRSDDQPAAIPADEQPYPIPETWTWVRLGASTTFTGGGTPSKSVPDYWNGTIPWASVKDLTDTSISETKDHISNQGLQNSSANICTPGDLLLATRIDPGRASVARTAIAINQDLKIIRSLHFTTEFLLHFFNGHRDAIRAASSGTTVKGISVSRLSSLPVPLPPLNEQKKIVEKITSYTETARDSEVKASAAIEQLRTAREQLISSALAGQLT
ncbi:restriction endonuclease subunit S [Nanchangia anserum]|uniref:Restriction endonuclease subunit S n=1 Tax=Nanchangia anserum TaxID=2692125 RepID=A0A8I0GDD1_9ACTO|nr:restriction endonuclease subunit S [Nanchangia anserum]MBD3689478.1 restriction endonuclease subunit S [Nanchangia anserum]QOX81671.1 restriction endonuclease subunit S [Nanchangia anserum]